MALNTLRCNYLTPLCFKALRSFSTAVSIKPSVHRGVNVGRIHFDCVTLSRTCLRLCLQFFYQT